MPADRRYIDVEIRDLSEGSVEACARLHRQCFPDKLESRLGLACIADCLRRRYLPAARDAHCRIAVERATDRLLGYLYAETIEHGELAHAFLSSPIALRHMLVRGWYRPSVWAWLLGRLWRLLTGRRIKVREPAANRAPGGEVAKMLAVHPDARGTNVGRDLMVDHELQARARGRTRLLGRVLRDNIKAERLYASIGWERSEPAAAADEVFAMHKVLRDDNVLAFTARPR